MSEVQRLLIEDGGQTYEIYIESKSNPNIPPPQDQEYDPARGYGFKEDAITKMREARQMIRGYSLYALSAFKDFGAAEIEEVTLKFGMKLGGKTGIPYITEGTAESNLEIQVKCKFPAQKQPLSQ